jgi:hypothetical protein
MEDKCNYYNTKSLNNILQPKCCAHFARGAKADISARGTKRVKQMGSEATALPINLFLHCYLTTVITSHTKQNTTMHSNIAALIPLRQFKPRHSSVYRLYPVTHTKIPVLCQRIWLLSLYCELMLHAKTCN